MINEQRLTFKRKRKVDQGFNPSVLSAFLNGVINRSKKLKILKTKANFGNGEVTIRLRRGNQNRTKNADITVSLTL